MDSTKITAGNRHRHYEKIVAKAANMDLVVFYKMPDEDWWQIEGQNDMPCDLEVEYFLCLPQHNENGQCLHWLNGGDVQNNITKHLRDDSWINFTPFESSICELWSCECNFMREESNFRIKPRKEKRWIAWNTRLGVIATTYKRKPESIAGHQIIEIEVEI